MLYSNIKDTSFDLVHTHGYFADICGLPAAKLLGINSLATCHGYISNDKKLRIYNKLDKIILRYCNMIITVSKDIRNCLIDSGIDKSHIVVIQNAIYSSYDQEELITRRLEKRRSLSIEQDAYVIGYLGRLSEEKGIRYLIEAGLKLKENVEAFKIMIIGDGPKRKELEDLAKLKGLENEIVFLGFQSDIEAWLSVLDIFVLPSLTEGTPMALLEAMSLGIPIVATAVGGVPNVIEHGVNGVLVDPCNVHEMSEKIRMLMMNPSLRSKFAAEAIKTIKAKFDIQQWCLKIENEYNSLLQRGM